jgi:type IV secretory pathway VirB10-like protein
MAESEESTAKGSGTSPLRMPPPEVTRLNRNALLLVMGLATVTVFVAVASMSNPHASSSSRADSTATRVPVVPQRPALPPLRVAARPDSIGVGPVSTRMPPVIAFEDRPRRVTARGGGEYTRASSPSRTSADDRDMPYERALVRSPLFGDRAAAPAPESASVSSHGGEPSDADLERALLAPLLKTPVSGAASNSGQPYVAAGGTVGDVSAVSQRAAREHREFLAASRGAATRGVPSLDAATSPYELTAGTAIDAALVTDLNSDLPGTVVAQVERDVYDSQTETNVLVPRGSRLIGRYDDRIVPGQSRMLVAWTRLLFPDGGSVELPGVAATDGRGATGVPGRADSHLTRVFEDAAVLSVLSAGAELSQPNGGGSAFTAPSVGQTIGAAAGAQLASLGTEMVRQGLTVKPTIVVPAGAPLAVLLADDLVFPGAYRDARSSAQ